MKRLLFRDLKPCSLTDENMVSKRCGLFGLTASILPLFSFVSVHRYKQTNPADIPTSPPLPQATPSQHTQETNGKLIRRNTLMY